MTDRSKPAAKRSGSRKRNKNSSKGNSYGHVRCGEKRRALKSRIRELEARIHQVESYLEYLSTIESDGNLGGEKSFASSSALSPPMSQRTEPGPALGGQAHPAQPPAATSRGQMDSHKDSSPSEEHPSGQSSSEASRVSNTPGNLPVGECGEGSKKFFKSAATQIVVEKGSSGPRTAYQQWKDGDL